MAALHSLRLVRVGFLLTLGSVLGSSCVVDKSGLVFDDDEFAEASDGNTGGNGEGGDGGDGTGSGGVPNAGGLGGETSSGGMGLGGDGALCTANHMQCNGKQVELCAGSEWIPIGGPCPNACVGGVCTGVCSPDSDACLSSIQTQHCSDVGEWEDEFCEFACVSSGACGGVCRPGDRDCSGDTRTLCGDDGQWVDQDTCPGDCEAGVCVGACTNDETQCSGDSENPIQITCNGTSWETSPEVPCDYVCDSETGECGGECVPFSSTCASSKTVQVCNSTATYEAATDCDYVCDSETGACGGECVPGTKRCGSGVTQACDSSGHWVTDIDCSGTTPVCLEPTAGSPECAECTPGAKKCSASANSHLTCAADGTWPTTGTTCKLIKTSPTVCISGSCIPIDEACDSCPKCPKGCVDSNTRWYCEDPLLGNPTLETADCSSGTTCSTGTCSR